MKSYKYILKVWGSTIVGGPVLLVAIDFITSISQFIKDIQNGNRLYHGEIEFILAFFLYGIILSIPTLVLIICLFPVLRYAFQKPLLLKSSFALFSCLFSVISIFISFWEMGIIQYSENLRAVEGENKAVYECVLYCTCIIFFSLFYKLELTGSRN